MPDKGAQQGLIAGDVAGYPTVKGDRKRGHPLANSPQVDNKVPANIVGK